MVLSALQHSRKFQKKTIVQFSRPLICVRPLDQGVLQFQIFQIPFVGADTCGFGAFFFFFLALMPPSKGLFFFFSLNVCVL